MTDGIHSCSYYCTRPECIRAQRDELRERLQTEVEDLYRRGWNGALETAALRFEHEFADSFGRDSASSFAIWLRRLKKYQDE
jgi:hypothetical protein